MEWYSYVFNKTLIVHQCISAKISEACIWDPWGIHNSLDNAKMTLIALDKQLAYLGESHHTILAGSVSNLVLFQAQLKDP